MNTIIIMSMTAMRVCSVSMYPAPKTIAMNTIASAKTPKAVGIPLIVLIICFFI